MLPLLCDECLDANLVRAMRREIQRRGLTIDLVRAVEVGLDHTPDEDILAWAAGAGRVLVTIDRKTMLGFAQDRLDRGEPMPGVLALRRGASFSQALEDLLLMGECYDPDDLRLQIKWVPLS